MEYLIISAVAFIMSGLTLFSGFGLGTVLMPTFALFLPVPVAVAATAVVHLANNCFKLILVGRRANWTVVGRFSVPAAGAAFVGASLLALFAGLPPLARYSLGERKFQVTAVKTVIGALIVLFAWVEVSRRFERLTPRAGRAPRRRPGAAPRSPDRNPTPLSPRCSCRRASWIRSSAPY